MVHDRGHLSPPNGKAMITESGANVAINGFDISGVAVPDGNGAAIRYEGGSLSLSRTTTSTTIRKDCSERQTQTVQSALTTRSLLPMAMAAARHITSTSARLRILASRTPTSTTRSSDTK